MNPYVDYNTTFKDDVIFGALFDAFSYRWACSCLANPEYEPSDVRKTILFPINTSPKQNA
jgi:hypothetical protein